MKILCWNCRGIENPETVRELCRKVKDKCPDLVFLMETKLISNKMSVIKQRMSFNNMLVVDCIGRSGGLALLWKEGMGVEIHNYSIRHINAVVCPPNSIPWTFTGFYGHPEAHRRWEAWKLLRHLKSKALGPWMCAGDFNEIVDPSEKVGGKRRSNFLMENFKTTLEECGLFEVVTKGPTCTWNNGREGEEFIMEKLDRMVASHDWHVRFPNVEVLLEAAIFSDHLSMSINLVGPQFTSRRMLGFRFEAKWADNMECREVIRSIWRKKTHGKGTWHSVAGKLEASKSRLKAWQRVQGGNMRQQINELSEQLLKAQAEHGGTDTSLLMKLKNELLEKQREDDLFWKQRAKEHWAKFGDQNSRFFHACATHKKKASLITGITDEFGQRWETNEQIGGAFTRYFQNLFTTCGPRHMEKALEAVEQHVTPSMNESLLKDFTVEEKNWAETGEEVSHFVLQILNNGSMNKELNLTYIALIPKTANPISVTEFRPISLFNVLYKLISKTLANRLKIVLPDIISPNQSAFVPDRLITDNVLAALETLHTMKSRMWGKVGHMAVKLDMSKAYDRVEWDFLEAIMERMGFAKALSSLLTQADRDGRLPGVPTSKRGPRLSHLFFADDSLLFFTKEEILRLPGIQSTQRYDKYLGLPALVGKSRRQAFNSIKDRVWRRLGDWKLKLLLQAGREILLKAVIQAIPTYSMTKLGTKPSFAWRSIQGARELLKDGLFWRVGNGQSINIWGDCWIPISSTYRIHSPSRVLDPSSKVSELLDNGKCGWNQELLKSIFTEEERVAITSIPISQTNQPDVQIWRCTNNGMFSVKSAYHLAKEMEMSGNPEGSLKTKESILWKTLWRLTIPNAAKNFLWRACHDLLPTKDNLLRRKVVTEPWCPFCEKEPETVYHALWGCPAATDVWGSSRRIFQKCVIEGSNFMETAEYILERSGAAEFGIFTEEQTEEFNKANEVSHNRSVVENNERGKKWLAPPQGSHKINWDVAIDKLHERMGIGVVIRGENGQVIAAMSKTTLGLLEPTMGEALAAYHAVCLGRNLGMQNIYLEGDAKQVVEAINSQTSTWSRFGHLIDDTRGILRSFSSWRCNFVYRNANEAAHRLAKAAITDISDRIWRDTTPNCIRDIVLMEQSVLSL
ncbi:uncharacterized protein LOC132169166 [Corylus avellana]|uniref:uncharacterized protein LOC132169166 n=1 Tax=Corylus avellana TaxID=13451 RepID=UPI00286BA51C|nr:uncharacterized protein LOC132169166 [Corylus avellana]